MRIKVYVKKGEYQSAIPGIMITIIFLSFSIGIFVSCFHYNNFIRLLSIAGAPLLFAIIFFIISLFLLFYLFKKPKGFNAKLTKKIEKNYKGKKITYMIFTAIKAKNLEDGVPQIYRCYTYGTNDLIVNKDYLIKIKEFNWKIKSVEELSSTNTHISKIPHMTQYPTFFILGFVFGRTRHSQYLTV